MFTGIVQCRLPLLRIAEAGSAGLIRLTLAPNWRDVRLGESVAVNGACLTVAQIDGDRLNFDVIAETLAKTNLGQLRAGDSANLERSLRIGDRIDGHFVQGHIDGVAIVTEAPSEANKWRIAADAPPELAKYLVPKGSVCLDGASLTLAAVNGRRFEVALIPTTLQITTLASLKPGWPLNLEADIFTKTIVHTLERMRESKQDKAER